MIGTTGKDLTAYRTERVVIWINETWCKGCEICVHVCQKKCLAMDGRGKVTVVNPEACNKCLLCDLLCPDFAIMIE